MTKRPTRTEAEKVANIREKVKIEMKTIKGTKKRLRAETKI